MYDADKFKTSRATPLQARGKERVRVILVAALGLFRERGVEETTTNDIAARAKIPIGSLYRYYPNKDAIITVLTDVYVDDLSTIFADIASHPLLPYLSWSELLFMIIDTWVHYSRMNGSFAFLFAEKANPRLRTLNDTAWQRLAKNFNAALIKRCPDLTERQLAACLQLAVAASELGINDRYEKTIGSDLHYEATEAIAGYLRDVCSHHNHDV